MMKTIKQLLIAGFIAFVVVIIYQSCGKDAKDENNHCPCIERKKLPNEKNFVGIENISFENYPLVDGSTSASILNFLVACKLLGLRYSWYGDPLILVETWIRAYPEDIPEQYQDFFGKRVKISQTHEAFMNLIDHNVDIIVTHRAISPDEKEYADSVGVSLIETTIALDAFVFIVNQNNPVKSLTVDQIQKIYTSQITDWSQVGGKQSEIKVFTRPRNSGSEEVFRLLVMNGLEPDDFPEASITLMSAVFSEIWVNENGICYTFSNYKDVMAKKCKEVPVIAINDICPSENTIRNKTYPFISEVRVAIRSDLDHNSMAYKLYEWLQSEHAKYTIAESGFFLSTNM